MAYIHRTPAGAGSSTVFTLSYWVKRAKLGAIQTLYSAGSANKGKFVFNAEDQLEVSDDGSDVVKTTRLFRDVGAWYHIVLAYDTGASGTDKVKIYVNGVQETAYATDNRSTAGSLNYVNAAEPQNIGADTSNPFYGEMSHVQMVDGAQLAPTEFGEVDATSGIWKIKTSCYATPGTNGFCLKMEDRTNLDLDSSSNAFTWTTSGDVTPTYDNPSNNFATLNPLTVDDGGAKTYSNGNTTVAETANSWTSAHSSLAVAAGKWYFESKFILTSSTEGYFGCASVPEINAKSSSTFYLGSGASMGYYTTDGNVDKGSVSSSYGNVVTTGQIMGLALDITNELAYFSINGVWQNSADPVAGSGGVSFPSGMTDGEYICLSASPNQSYWECNFGNGYFGTTAVASTNADDAGIGSFEYDVPTGYYALCTKNIKAYGG